MLTTKEKLAALQGEISKAEKYLQSEYCSSRLLARSRIIDAKRAFNKACATAYIDGDLVHVEHT